MTRGEHGVYYCFRQGLCFSRSSFLGKQGPSTSPNGVYISVSLTTSLPSQDIVNVSKRTMNCSNVFLLVAAYINPPQLSVLWRVCIDPEVCVVQRAEVYISHSQRVLLGLTDDIIPPSSGTRQGRSETIHQVLDKLRFSQLQIQRRDRGGVVSLVSGCKAIPVFAIVDINIVLRTRQGA